MWEMDDYYKGPPLKLGELRGLGDEEVVWVVYYDLTSGDGKSLKIDGPSHIEAQGDDLSWLLDEAGSEFAMEGDDGEECVDDGGDGSGEMRLYKALLGAEKKEWRIFKYELPPPTGGQTTVVQMPEGAKVLKAASQVVTSNEEHIFLWALVDPSAYKETRTFEVYPTDSEVLGADELVHVDTVLMHGGSLIFHVFERNSERGE